MDQAKHAAAATSRTTTSAPRAAPASITTCSCCNLREAAAVHTHSAFVTFAVRSSRVRRPLPIANSLYTITSHCVRLACSAHTRKRAHALSSGSRRTFIGRKVWYFMCTIIHTKHTHTHIHPTKHAACVELVCGNPTLRSGYYRRFPTVYNTKYIICYDLCLLRYVQTEEVYAVCTMDTRASTAAALFAD